jgi:hypothetical protein
LIQIQSSALLVTVLPEIGGKIGQIRDRHSGRDLLIPPQRPYRTIPLDGDWLEHDTSGMDDCFPNVAKGQYPEEPWATVLLPDLGEWTHGVWTVSPSQPSEVVIERAGTAFPYFATRTIRFVEERTLEFSYRVENRGSASIRYLWSAHPLISVPDEYEIQLNPGNLSYRLFPSDGKVRPWPSFGNLDLSRAWIPAGTDLKIFVTGLSEGWCTLRLAAHTLRFAFDLRDAPVLGLWFNNCGFPAGSDRPFRCIAVEPCTTPSDQLDELGPSAYRVLAPGATACWSLRLNIAPHTSAQAE